MYTRSASCLDLVECRFGQLAGEPGPLIVDGGPLGCGLPDRPIPLDDLRVLLLKRQTSWLTKDVVWQELTRRAHAEPDPWVLAAAGMMLPGLKHIGGKLGSRFPGDRNDLDSEILEGFLQALDIAEPRQPKLASQLYWAAFRRGHEACNRENRLARCQVSMDDACRVPRKQNSGHPDLVLAEAMLDGAVSPREADLICRVHLDKHQRGTTASSMGVSRHQVGLELASAQRRLVAYLGAA